MPTEDDYDYFMGAFILLQQIPLFVGENPMNGTNLLASSSCANFYDMAKFNKCDHF